MDEKLKAELLNELRLLLWTYECREHRYSRAGDSLVASCEDEHGGEYAGVCDKCTPRLDSVVAMEREARDRCKQIEKLIKGLGNVV